MELFIELLLNEGIRVAFEKSKDINGALLAINDDGEDRVVNGKTMRVSRRLYDAFENERNALNRPSAINQRNSMNKEVREMFGIDL